MYERTDLGSIVILSKSEELSGGGVQVSEIVIDVENMTYHKEGSDLTYEDALIVGEVMREFTLEGALENYGFKKAVNKENQEVWSHDDWFGNHIYLDIDGSDVELFIDGWGTLPLGDPKMWRIFWTHVERMSDWGKDL